MAQVAGSARLRRRGFWLEYASMAWMTAEAAVAVTAGVLASSIALIGFGLDSVIEFFAAAVVVWQLRGEDAGKERETRAVRLIGVTFFALALYLAVEGIGDVVTHARPGQSAAGLAVAGAALIVMPGLAVAKRRTGRALGNPTLIADSAETAFCAFTAAATLTGVSLNTWLGWWWADPAAAFVIAVLAAREGLEAWGHEDSGSRGFRLLEELPEDLLANLQGAVLAQDSAGDLGMGCGPSRGGGVTGEEVDVLAAH
jgi:divalent metal cation (Fe/Co/Zn/Cd) transporter